MACPVCGGTEVMEINVRIKQESDLKQVIGSTWDGRNVARCNECGVLYDHQYAESEADDQQSAETMNCPECGSLTSRNRDTCSYCGTALNPEIE